MFRSQEILGSMSNGATLVLRGKSSTQWRAAMKTVDVVVATPSMLVPHKPEDYPLIKTIAVAGEPCPKCEIQFDTLLSLSSFPFSTCR